MILLNDFKAEPEKLINQQLKAIEEVVRSGWYILGKKVEAFEQDFATYCDTKHAVGVGNGMDAIEIGLRALKIGLGDEVITTSMTAFASVLAIIRAGATPVLADIDPTTGILDITSVERCINSKTKAVMVVHLYGQVSKIDEMAVLCKKHNLHLIEDCAQAHGAKHNGIVAGNFGAFGAYSFYPTKNLGALGDGGAIITNSDTVAEEFKKLRNYGQSVRYYHPIIGLNSRLDELHAAILSVRLNWITPFTDRRKQIAKKYFKHIKNQKVTLLAQPNAEENHVYHLFVVLCHNSAEREKLMVHLKENEIASLIHYPVPVHHQEPCKSIKTDPQGLTNAQNHANTCLSIPCHPQMSDDDVQKVVDAVNSF